MLCLITPRQLIGTWVVIAYGAVRSRLAGGNEIRASNRFSRLAASLRYLPVRPYMGFNPRMLR